MSRLPDDPDPDDPELVQKILPDDPDLVQKQFKFSISVYNSFTTSIPTNTIIRHSNNFSLLLYVSTESWIF